MARGSRAPREPAAPDLQRWQPSSWSADGSVYHRLPKVSGCGNLLASTASSLPLADTAVATCSAGPNRRASGAGLPGRRTLAALFDGAFLGTPRSSSRLIVPMAARRASTKQDPCRPVREGQWNARAVVSLCRVTRAIATIRSASAHAGSHWRLSLPVSASSSTPLTVGAASVESVLGCSPPELLRMAPGTRVSPQAALPSAAGKLGCDRETGSRLDASPAMLKRNRARCQAHRRRPALLISTKPSLAEEQAQHSPFALVPPSVRPPLCVAYAEKAVATAGPARGRSCRTRGAQRVACCSPPRAGRRAAGSGPQVGIVARPPRVSPAAPASPPLPTRYRAGTLVRRPCSQRLATCIAVLHAGPALQS